MPWSISPYLRHSIQAADPVIAMTAKRGKKNRVQAQSLPHSNGWPPRNRKTAAGSLDLGAVDCLVSDPAITHS